MVIRSIKPSFGLLAIITATLICDASATSSFYVAQPAELSGKPGSIIRTEQLPHAPAGSVAHRVLYRSVSPSGASIAVSGIIIVPNSSRTAPGGIVAWAHPTTGVVTQCAPSLRGQVFDTIPGLHEMVAKGYVVAATDYPGLGTEGTHPYLVGVSEGRAVLDSVRAARQLLGDTAAGRRFAVWGHSQGGHAALFAASLADSYAPELRLVGVAAAAPATALATLLDDDIESVNGRILTAMTLYSWARVYGAPIERVVVPEAIPVVNRIAQHCVQSITDVVGLRIAELPLQRRFLAVENLTQIEPWRSLLARNTPGRMPRIVPVFISQGTSDSVVPPSVTQAYVARLCRSGSRVRFITLPGVIHALTGYRSASAAADWMSDRFADRPAPSECEGR